MKKNAFAACAFLLIAAGLVAFTVQKPAVAPVAPTLKWYTWEEAAELNKTTPKKIFVDVYTDWCGWCKEMDRTTYQHDKLSKYINEKYYAVKLNAESREDIIFNKKNYTCAQFAEYLLYGRMSYPTTVFLSSLDARPAPLAGYLKAKEMEAPLKYFGEGAFKSQTFVEFNKIMKNEW